MYPQSANGREVLQETETEDEQKEKEEDEGGDG